jgi:hypothetical protein
MQSWRDEPEREPEPRRRRAPEPHDDRYELTDDRWR